MTTVRNKMEGNVRTLEAHPANDAAASELKQHLKDINAQYWRSSYLMEIYIYPCWRRMLGRQIKNLT